MDLHADAAKFARQISNNFASVSRVSIDIDGQYWSASGIDADCSSQNFRLPHQIGCDLSLDTHNGLHSGMSLVQDAGWRRGRRPERKENKGNCCHEYQDDAKESINWKHNGVVCGKKYVVASWIASRKIQLQLGDRIYSPK